METGARGNGRARRSDAVWIALAITTFALFLGFRVKDPCAKNLGWTGFQYSRNCYSDITALYGIRHFNENHPIAYRDTELEYPALTGLFITAANAPVSSRCPASGPCGTRGFFVANAIGLAPFGLAGAGALAAIARRRRRILGYAAAPAMLAYAFHNWDLIPVGLTACGLWAFTRRRDGLAGVLLGLGAAAKLYPAFVVPALMLARWREEGRPADAGRLLAGAAAGFVVPNAIVYALAGFDGWWYPWKFQSERFPNFETSWYFIYRHLGRGGGDFWFKTYPTVAQWTSTALFLAGAGLLLWREMRREKFRPVVASMGMVLLFLVTAKVFSPQYALWVLPFFVLVGIPWWGYGLFVLADMFVLAAIWLFLIPETYPAQFGAPAGVGCRAFPPCAEASNARLNLLELAVWTRYVVLLVILWLSRGAEEHVDESGAPQPAIAGSASMNA